MSIEAAGNSFRKLHYLGAKLKDVKNSVVWFGGKNLTVEEVLQAVGKKYGIPQDEIVNLDLDSVIGGAITEKVEAKVVAKREKRAETKKRLNDMLRNHMADHSAPLLALARVKSDPQEGQERDENANMSPICRPKSNNQLTARQPSPAVSVRRYDCLKVEVPSPVTSIRSLKFADQEEILSVSSSTTFEYWDEPGDLVNLAEAGLNFVNNRCPNFAQLSPAAVETNTILFCERKQREHP